MAQGITMAQLARSLGISKATVCRALKDDPGIAQRTRIRVQEEARRQSYHPNPLLSAAAARRWDQRPAAAGVPVAFLTEVPEPTDLTAAGRFVSGARQRAGERGFAVHLFRLADFDSGRHLSRVLFSRGIEGIIVGPVKKPNQPLDLEWDRFSAVSCGGDFFPPPLHKIQVNQNQLATLAYREAIEYGYRRIGVSLEFQDRECPDEAERFGAFAYQQRRYAGYLPEIPMLTSRDPEDFRTWFRRHRPDLVIGLAWNSHRSFHSLESDLRADVGFLALLSMPDHPAVACIDNLENEIGAVAFDYLESMIRMNQKGLPEHRRFIFTEAVFRPATSFPKIGAPPPGLEHILQRGDRGSYRHFVHAS